MIRSTATYQPGCMRAPADEEENGDDDGVVEEGEQDLCAGN